MKYILVCGGRDYKNVHRVYRTLTKVADDSPEPITIVHGDATGADSIAETWCAWSKTQSIPYPADWKAHGRAAGPIRNTLMLDSHPIALVVAFPGGRGTADMIRQAEGRGIKVMKVEDE